MKRLKSDGNWVGLSDLYGIDYVCGYCGKYTASNRGWWFGLGGGTSQTADARIHICAGCRYPTLIVGGEGQFPAPLSTEMIAHLPQDIDVLFDEVRRTSLNCPNTAALACRKILMHVAVERGARENETFQYYVQYLADNHFIPAGSDVWVDEIRRLGNEANHEIHLIEPEQAARVVKFTEVLLKIVYEFPGMLPAKK